MAKNAFLLLLVVTICAVSMAHIPELVLEDRNYTTEPVIVDEPEISYAYYGKLQGSPQIYSIESDEPFRLYVSLLVPYTGQEETSDVEFHIMKDGQKIVMRHNHTNWTRWYEEYSGDWYLQGPTYGADVEAGTYLVEVHSKTNSEDYTLAIGDIERFGPMDIAGTLFVLPFMKAFFWGDYLGLILLVGILIMLVAGIILAIKRIRSRG